MKIYHNPRCRKSRETLAILEDKGAEFTIVEYLKTPPTEKELKKLLKLLNIPAVNLMRKGEAIFKEEYKGKTLSEQEAIEAMVLYPKLIERPIVIKDKTAIIGRPPEKVLTLL